MKKQSLIGIAVAGLFVTSGFGANALRVGAAKVDVTKNSIMPVNPNPKYDHERVYVRAVVIDNGATRAALISVPGSSSNYDWPAMSKGVSAELNCPVENIVLSGTHSHSYRSDPARLAQAVVETVRQAKASCSRRAWASAAASCS
jgi:hypothetical protein